MKLRLSAATIAKLELGPNDIIVIHSKRQVTGEQAETLKAQLRAIVGDYKSIVLPPDLTISKVGRPA